jgi:hypothetical protein
MENAMLMLLRGATGGSLPGDPPRQPDPAHFDFYDYESVNEFHRQNNAYLEHVKEQAITPHKAAIQEAAAWRAYNEVTNEYRGHPQFREIEAAAQYAIGEAAENGQQLTIKEAFANANNPQLARPGWAGNVHPPKQLKRLGEIAAHRQLLRKAWGR